MRRLVIICTALGAAILLVGCASDHDSGPYVYNDWLYYHDDWYDDDFWIWVDDHPDCCDDQDDVRQALKDWYDGLDQEQQQAVRDRMEAWMDEHDVVPAAGQIPRDLVLDTAAERWSALTPQERQQWLDQRPERIERRQSAAPPGVDPARRLTSSPRRPQPGAIRRVARERTGRGVRSDIPSRTVGA